MNTTAIEHNIQISTAFKALQKLPATCLFILAPCFIYTSASWIDHSPLGPSAFPPLCLCSGGFPHQEDSLLNFSIGQDPVQMLCYPRRVPWSSQSETFPSSSTHQVHCQLYCRHLILYHIMYIFVFLSASQQYLAHNKSIIFFKWIHLPKSLRFNFTLIRRLIKVP